MKLSDMTQTELVKVLVVGPSGTGKTVLAAGFPTPIRYLDFDNKISSAAQHYSKDADRLGQIDVEAYAKMPRETRMKKFLDELMSIQKLQHAKQPLPFKTLVLDSLTTFTHYLLEDYIHVSQRGIKRALDGINAMQDYQLLDKHMTQIVTGLLTLDCNIVFIGHTQLEKDESTGSITNQILMPGKFSFKLPIYFEEVYFSKIGADGKHLLQTQSDARTICRTQRKLPKEIPASYDSIIGSTQR